MKLMIFIAGLALVAQTLAFNITEVKFMVKYEDDVKNATESDFFIIATDKEPVSVNDLHIFYDIHDENGTEADLLHSITIQFTDANGNTNEVLSYSDVTPDKINYSAPLNDVDNYFMCHLDQKICGLHFFNSSKYSSYEGLYTIKLMSFEGSVAETTYLLRPVKYCTEDEADFMASHEDRSECSVTVTGRKDPDGNAMRLGCYDHVYGDNEAMQVTYGLIDIDNNNNVINTLEFERVYDEPENREFQYLAKTDQVLRVDNSAPANAKLRYSWKQGSTFEHVIDYDYPTEPKMGCPDLSAYCQSYNDDDIFGFPNMPVNFKDFLCSMDNYTQIEGQKCRREVMPAPDTERAVLNFRCKDTCTLSWSEDVQTADSFKELICEPDAKAWTSKQTNVTVAQWPKCSCNGDETGGASASSFSLGLTLALLFIIKALAL